MAARDEIGECLRDIEPEFIKSASSIAAWEYYRLYEELSATPGLSDEYRREEFNRRRGGCLVKALMVAAQEHGVPYEFLKLDCNGQSKLLVKCGRVVLFQEAICAFSDSPKAADYKQSLADTHGLVRQLELDLGDIPGRVIDWDGSIIGAVLHAQRGPLFNKESMELGLLMLAVPDAAYSHWLVRIDLHNIAMEGISIETDPDPAEAMLNDQPDNVRVTLRNPAKKEMS